MAQETLQVTSAVHTTNWNLSSGADFVSAVNQPDDNFSSYIISGTPGAFVGYDLANTSALGVGDTVNFVRVVAMIADDDGVSSVSVILKVNSGGNRAASGGLTAPGTAFGNVHFDFATDPATGLPWTKSAIDALQIECYDNSPSVLLDLTTFYAIVDYTLPIPNAPPGDTYFVPPESRKIVLPNESSRVFTLPPEQRTLYVVSGE